MSQNSSDNMNCDVHLHAEIELLKQALVDKQSQLIAMETACLRESDRQVELEDSIIAWQDKYDRLYESHKRVQKVNQNLEDKLLKLVDRHSNERAQLTSDVATLSVRLAQANYNIATLQREIERYKTDMGLAIQLLQCKPDGFVSQKVTSLPLEMQSKVTQYMRLDTQSHSDSEGSISGHQQHGHGLATSGSYRVLPASDSPPPMCPFPPTAMVYSMRGLDDEPRSASPADGLNHIKTGTITSTNTIIQMNGIINGTNATHATAAAADMISPSLMARYLQDELKASELKHCDTCLCASGSRDLQVLADTAHSYSVGTQTHLHGDANNALCLRCNSNLNSPSRTNSPYIMKLVKSSDSVISETKSSYSGSLAALDMTGYMGGTMGPQQTQRKDDLTVNPMLGHHRLCDRKLPSSATAAAKQRESALAAAAAVELQIENELRAMTGRQASQLSGGSGPVKSATTPMTTAAYVSDVQAPQQPMDTASGSTNSLWSKTSSTNNNANIHGTGGNANIAEGAKMFETFNRNLIKSIKSDNPKVAGPRLCALRIQNGTSNILLDNIEQSDDATATASVVYTRRSRFLDEELDETKDIITSPSRPLASVPDTATVDMDVGAPLEVIVIGNAVGAAPVAIGSSALRKDLLSGSSMSISTTANDRSPQLEPVILSAAARQQQQQFEPPSTSISRMGGVATVAAMPLLSAAGPLSGTGIADVPESTSLRRQQLSRVAEWVQSNHLDCVNGVGAATTTTGTMLTTGASTMSPLSVGAGRSGGGIISAATSIDSGYKTKGAHRNNNPNAASSSPLTMDYAQNLSNNNNHNDVVDRGQRSSGDGCTTTEETRSMSEASAANAAEAKSQIDFAQMEYNVKQFLLKQNEWSTQPPQQTAATAVTHRTETNL